MFQIPISIGILNDQMAGISKLRATNATPSRGNIFFRYIYNLPIVSSLSSSKKFPGGA